MSTVLVVYASKHGSTEGIAAQIARTLNARGLDAACLEASKVKRLEPYDAVVLGSAVYMRRWRPEARRFLRHFASELAERPFWIFSSGPVGDPAEDNPAWNEPPATIAKAEGLGARGHVVFGGSLSAAPHGVMQRSMAEKTPEAFRDRRDWRQIRAWADGIAAELRTRVSAQPPAG
jgi:menaquinone-dependent protoporphyrinogen oxidase